GWARLMQPRAPGREGRGGSHMTVTFFGFSVWFWLQVALVGLALLLVFAGAWTIREDQSGLVIKRYGRPLPSGRIIALNGEAGYQARMLSPGWYFGLWFWRYKIERVPVVVVHPGEIALIVAADGEAIPAERVLGRAVACDNFQDAEAFLKGH